MGEFADHTNNEQSQSLEHLLAYEAGELSDQEAIDLGILDEYGSMSSDSPRWGVQDAESLATELDKCDAFFNRRPTLIEPQPEEQVWVSNGKVCVPSEMTTQHLKNAITYAERNNISGPAVEALCEELGRRNNQ